MVTEKYKSQIEKLSGKTSTTMAGKKMLIKQSLFAKTNSYDNMMNT